MLSTLGRLTAGYARAAIVGPTHGPANLAEPGASHGQSAGLAELKRSRTGVEIAEPGPDDVGGLTA